MPAYNIKTASQYNQNTRQKRSVCLRWDCNSNHWLFPA